MIQNDDRAWVGKDAFAKHGVRKNPSYRYHPNGNTLHIDAYTINNSDDTNSIDSGIDSSEGVDTQQHNLKQLVDAITDNLPDVLIQLDATNNIVYVSPSSKRILGYEPREILGSQFDNLLYPEDRVLYANTLKATLSTRSPSLAIETRIIGSDGQLIWGETKGTLLFDSGSQYQGAIFITRDVSERHKIQNIQSECRHWQKVIEKEQEYLKLQSRMLTRIAHEFRTPLAIIQIGTENLADYWEMLTAEKRSRKSEIVQNQIKRITNMLDKINNSVNNTASIEIRYLACDLSEVCKQAIIQSCKDHTVSIERFQMELAEYAPIIGDTLLLKSALGQILDNAIQYSPESAPIQVLLRPSKNGWELKVIDHGIGIPKTEISQIFEPFFRGSNISEISGLGLGLTIAKTIVELHSGYITVSNNLGEGTEVNMYITSQP